MSNRALLVWLLVLGLVVLALLVAGFWSSAYDSTEREQLQAAWVDVEALAVQPAPAPAGSITAASFADDLERFSEAHKPADLAAFERWLSEPGEHRLVASDQLWDDHRELALVDALLDVGSRCDPTQVAGLLQLTHGLRTEGGTFAVMFERPVTETVVLNVLAHDLPVPAGAARWRPDPDAARHCVARAAVRLVRALERDPRTATTTGPAVVPGLLERLGGETLAWATRGAALRLLRGEQLPSPGEVSLSSLVTDVMLGDTESLERLMAQTLNPLGKVFPRVAETTPDRLGAVLPHGSELVERYDEMLSRAAVSGTVDSLPPDESR